MSAVLEAPPVAGDQATTTTIATRVRDWASRDPDRVAMREKDYGIWQEVTWSEYWDNVLDVAHGLMAIGVEPGDRVALHAENRREWLYSDIAIVAVRAMTVGLYPTNPPAEVRHLLSDSGARVIIAEDQEQVDKALEVADDCPDLEFIVYIEPRGIRGHYHDRRLKYWNDLVAEGRSHREDFQGAVERRMAAAASDDTMTLIYTSGTTGPPKGAMLSVANVEFAIEVLIEGGGFTDPPPSKDDVIVSYLPLCHVAERIFTVWFNAAVGVQVNFAESIETVQANLAEVQPTILFGVPRIWEKILAGINIRMSSASPLKRASYWLWMRVARRIGASLVANGGRWAPATRATYAVAWLFLLRSLKKRIGVSKVRYAASGAAPIAPDVLEFFMGIGVPMHEVYGMTENSAVATANRPGRVKLGTVGEAHAGVELRIDEDTGELLTRSAGNFQGYWRMADKTAETLTSDNWLHTGDVAEWVDGTHIKITDRAKDIIITAGGKNVAPSEIENAVKASPFVREAVVVGDGRKHLTALIGIELDTVGDWAQRKRIPFTTYRDLSEKPEVLELVRGILREVNGRFSRVEGIKAFRMIPKELDHEDGELTATQKVKRAALHDMFVDLVEDMYATRGASGAPGSGAGGQV